MLSTATAIERRVDGDGAPRVKGGGAGESLRESRARSWEGLGGFCRVMTNPQVLRLIALWKATGATAAANRPAVVDRGPPTEGYPAPARYLGRGRLRGRG